MTVPKVLFASGKQNWCTPDLVLDLVRKVASIALDPCGNQDNTVGATTVCVSPEENLVLQAELSYRLLADGLAHDWSKLFRREDGLCFCNPPYDDDAASFMERCATLGALGYEVIGLPAARTDTRWWHQHVKTANAICFWRGRLRFVGANNSAPFPSALPYWGPDPQLFKQIFSPYGQVLLT